MSTSPRQPVPATRASRAAFALLSAVAAALPASAQEEPDQGMPSPLPALGLPFPVNPPEAGPAPADETKPEPAPEEPAARPEDPRIAALLAASPFLPDGFSPPGGQGGQAQPEAPVQRSVELRGAYEVGGQTFVNLFNLGTQKGEWVRVGETRGPYQVRSYENGRGVAVVAIGGRVEELAFKKPSDQPIPVQSAPVAAVPVVGSPPAPQPGQAQPGGPGGPPAVAAAGTQRPGNATVVPGGIPRPRRIVLPPAGNPSAVAGGGGGAQRAVNVAPGQADGPVININVPDPTAPQPQAGGPSGPVDPNTPVMREGQDAAAAPAPGTLTGEQLIQMLTGRGGNP